MGVPYSRQINSAFDQVTPLVAAGFRILQTSKNISILLAVVQILTTLLLFLILLVLVALIITVSPDLEYERRELVTPIVHQIAAWAIDRTWLRIAVWTMLVGGAVGATTGWSLTRGGDDIAASDTEGTESCFGTSRDVEVAGDHKL